MDAKTPNIDFKPIIMTPEQRTRRVLARYKGLEDESDKLKTLLELPMLFPVQTGDFDLIYSFFDYNMIADRLADCFHEFVDEERAREAAAQNQGDAV